MLRFFTGPARLIEISVGCASPQALHTAKTSYLGTMVPCRDTLPALPLCFARSEMSRSIVISSQLWTTTYTGLGLEIKRPLSLFRRSVLRIIINPLFGKFELCSACSDVRDTVGAMTTTISAIVATMHDETLDKGRGLRPAVPFRAPLISCFASGPIRKIDGGHSKKLLDKLERSVVRGRPLQEIC